MKNKIKSLVLAGMVLASPAMAEDKVITYHCAPVKREGKDPIIYSEVNIHRDEEGKLTKFFVIHFSLSGKLYIRDDQYTMDQIGKSCYKNACTSDDGVWWHGLLKSNPKIQRMFARLSFKENPTAWRYEEWVEDNALEDYTPNLDKFRHEFICR
jgi:hypothetical protein